MSYDEVQRRIYVAAARRAGTIIREEALVRQALTASVNRPLAEALLKQVEELLQIIPDFERGLAESTKKALEEGKPLVDSILEDLLSKAIQFLPLAVIGTLKKAVNILTDVNNIIDVANKIIDELSKEGIYLPKINKIEIPDNALLIVNSLKEAKQRLETIIEFFKELEKYGSEDK